MLLVTLIGQACWRETKKKGLNYAHEKLTKHFTHSILHGIAIVLLICASEHFKGQLQANKCLI